MTGFTDVFGGSTLEAAQVAYQQVTLTSNLVTVWPAFATSGSYLARLMEVSCSVPGLSIALPDATLTAPGQDVFFNNTGSQSFTITDAAGGALVVLAPGQVRYLYLAANLTPAGTWRSVLFGAGTANVDASQLAGAGLAPLNAQLVQAEVVSTLSSSAALTTANLAQTVIWAGGTGALSLPALPLAPPGFFFALRNQGTGPVTLTPAGAQVINGGTSLVLGVGDSCLVRCDSAAWYTVGLGRNTQFNFTQLLKTVTGGTYALTLLEAANVIQTYTGALTANQVITVPGVVQVYYVSNQTSGSYSLTFRSPTPGATVSIPTGQNAVLFCDGVNVFNAATTTSGLGAIVFGAGSVGSPSVAVSQPNLGLFQPATNQLGVASNNTQVAVFDPTGFWVTSPAATAVSGVLSSLSNALLFIDRLAGKVGQLLVRTAGVNRWGLQVDGSAESGSNAGSNLSLVPYSDAGAALSPALTANRATGVLAGSLLNTEPTQALVDGATINWDWTKGRLATVTLGGNRAVAAITDPLPGTSVLVVSQDATGNRTLAWDSSFKWAGGTPPLLSTAANAVDVISFLYDGAHLVGSLVVRGAA